MRKGASKVGQGAGDPPTFEGLDRLFHERARLAILTALVQRPKGAPFGELKEHCQLTDGNLSRHLQALREAGVVELWKRAAVGRPRTIVVITSSGRARFVAYLDALERVVQDALRSSRVPARGGSSSSLGLGGSPGLAPA